MLWDVHYIHPSHTGERCLQVEANTVSAARYEALPIIGSLGWILRIDRAYPEVPVTDPARRKVQGT